MLIGLATWQRALLFYPICRHECDRETHLITCPRYWLIMANWDPRTALDQCQLELFVNEFIPANIPSAFWSGAELHSNIESNLYHWWCDKHKRETLNKSMTRSYQTEKWFRTRRLADNVTSLLTSCAVLWPCWGLLTMICCVNTRRATPSSSYSLYVCILSLNP